MCGRIIYRRVVAATAGVAASGKANVVQIAVWREGPCLSAIRLCLFRPSWYRHLKMAAAVNQYVMLSNETVVGVIVRPRQNGVATDISCVWRRAATGALGA